MAQFKKIEILSSAKILAVLMALVGGIAGIFYSFGGVNYDVVTTGSVSLGTALAFLALIGMPVSFAVPGFIVGAIGALLYNLAARWVGGLAIDIEQ